MGMREEFEIEVRKLLKSEQHDDFSINLMFEIGSNGKYRSIRVNGAWWGWQASRAALVVTLPDREIYEYDAGYTVYDLCAQALTDAGVSYK